MNVSDLTERNIASWQHVIEGYESFLAIPGWEWLGPVLHLVKQIANSKRAQLFRGGTAVWHLIISTAEQHGLKDEDPFVVVNIEKYQQDHPIQIEFWAGFDKKVDSCACDTQNILSVLDPFLVRLWNETRGRSGEIYPLYKVHQEI